MMCDGGDDDDDNNNNDDDDDDDNDEDEKEEMSMIMKNIWRKHCGRACTTACYTRARRVRPQQRHLQLQHVCIGNQQTVAG